MLNFVGLLAAARSSSELGGGVNPPAGDRVSGSAAGASASATGSGSGSAA
jgi:hypothetical protein